MHGLDEVVHQLLHLGALDLLGGDLSRSLSQNRVPDLRNLPDRHPRAYYGPVKITTWNVNSIHARKDMVLDWIERNRPDVILMQETKSTDQEFPVDDLGDLGYDAVFTGERSYNGVAICARDEITGVMKGLPGSEDQKRFISAVVGGIRFISVYVPNGQSLGSDKYAYKLDWLARLVAYLPSFGLPGVPLVMSGDYNIAPFDVDAWDPKEVSGGTHVSPPERAAFHALEALGLTDAYRALNPDTQEFSWWDYRAGSFQKNMGLRIDIHLLTPEVMKRASRVTIDRVARTKEKASDHAPVTLELQA